METYQYKVHVPASQEITTSTPSVFPGRLEKRVNSNLFELSPLELKPNFPKKIEKDVSISRAMSIFGALEKGTQIIKSTKNDAVKTKKTEVS